MLGAILGAGLPAIAAAQGFHGVCSRDGLDTWAVGDSGIYYRSLDAGLSWSSGTLGTARLWDVVARDLTELVAGDGGRIWRSGNGGGTFTQTVLPGAPDLRSIVMPSATTAFVAGASGAIFKSTDGGINWTPQVSGASVRLNALQFSDELYGWAVGENGTVLATSDGGDTWAPVTVPTTNELFGVDQRGRWVWVVGARGTALQSADWGRSFDPMNLKLDAHSDVRDVWMQSADSVYLVGGGGFIRRTVDRGRTWDFPIHNMHGQIVDIEFTGASGFVVSSRNRLVMSSIDHGATWRFPTGATLTRAWVLKQAFAGSARGSTFGLNDVYTNTIYCGLGNTVYRSRDAGETWASIATIPQCTKMNAFWVSPKDTNVMVAAITTATKQLVRSDDHGQSWYTTLMHDFGEYGIPMTYDSDHPDTVFFGGDYDSLYRSTDGGKNWQHWSITVPPSGHFRSPCDIVVIPDSSNIVLVADGTTGFDQGQYFKSIDGGRNFTLMETRPVGCSEIPGMSNSRLRNNVVFGTNWGGGGVQRSPDYGDTWPSVSTVLSAWGTDISRDDPNLMIFGTYSGGASYLSVDGGTTFAAHVLTGSNYSFFLRDRETVLAEQAGGIYKMSFTYNYTPQNAQLLLVNVPNGGEVWNAGTLQDISWSSINLAVANIEFKGGPGELWQLVAQVPGYAGHYGWEVPNLPTTQGKIRVRDAWDGSPTDSSNAVFTIIGTTTGVGEGPLAFALWQNRPNPFTGSTQIGYALPHETDVDIDVYDLQGQRVASLVHGRKGPGRHSVSFGPGVRGVSGERIAALPAGVYFYRMQAGSFSSTRKMLLLR